MATDQELLSAGVDPAAVATLVTDRAALAERENAAALDKIAPVISAEEAASELDKIAPIISEETAQLDAIAPIINPVQELDSEALFELAKTKEFSPIDWAQQNPQRATDPNAVKKLADVHARVRERGFTASDLPSAGTAIKGVGGMIAGAAKQGWNYLNAFVGIPLAGVAGAVTGQGPEFGAELELEGQRRMIENLAGTESAVTGLAQLPGRAIGKIAHRVGTISGLGKPYDQQTDAEKSKAFFDDLGTATAAGEIAQGKGGLTQAVSGETQKELAEAGKSIRPEEVETLAAGDPLSFLTFGKAFGAVGGVVGKAIPKSAGPLIERAGAATERAAAQVGGRAIQTAGKLTEWGGVATKVTGKALPIIGAIKGTAVAGPAGTIGGLAAGSVAGRAAERIGRTIDVTGEGVTAFGRQAATGVATTPYSQLARDVFQSAPIMASETLAGATFDIGLAAATSESPQETEAAVLFGTALGALKGVGRGALKVAQGQIITPRTWGTAKATPAYRNFSALDGLHTQSQQTAAPGQVQRANAIREFLGNKVEAYLMPDAAAMEKAVTDLAIRQGETPAAAQALAKSAAASEGMFTGDFKDDAGKTRRVVLLNNADAAPHEAFHGLQDVLGEQGNHVVDALVFQEYAPQWESLGQQYAKRLGGTGEWRDVVLDKSRWGNAAAAEKTLRDAANKIQTETGVVSTETARAMAEKVLAEARQNGAGWREILTPEEATAEANKYLARELAAENFDIAFKHLNSGLIEGNSLPEKLARVVARTAAFFGAEPLAGVKTEALKIEPRRAVVEAVTTQGRTMIEPANVLRGVDFRPARKAEVTKWAKAPETPATGTAEAAKVTEWLKTAEIPVASRAEAAQTLAQAIENQQGVRLTYFGAKGEPGGDPAALRPERRAEIEAQRDAPNADRPLVSKDFHPYGAIITSKGPQFKGWSPSNWNANAVRLAEWMTAHPEAAKSIPLAHDLKTEAGKRGLQADLQTFVQNQQAGFTGSGLELVVPAEAGATQPAKTGVKPVTLPQERADVISYLFNLQLPGTPRIASGKLPLNIVGQRVSKATLPGRVVEPIRPRGEFAGPKAEALGISGERVLEVNPFRQAVEKAAKDAGVPPPTLIEAAQILALERIAHAEGAPELAPFGGNVLTLTAGFLPKELAGKSVPETIKEVNGFSADQWRRVTTEFDGKFGAGLTGLAFELGAAVKNKAELAAYENARSALEVQAKAAMKSGDFDSAMGLATRSQFYRELLEAATDGPSADFIRSHRDPNFVAPFPKENP